MDSQRAKDVSICLLRKPLGKGEEVRGLIMRGRERKGARGLNWESPNSKYQMACLE